MDSIGMRAKNAIIVVVDRLSASYLAPYGNTWIDTPDFNRLASESTLFEFALSNSPELADAYGAYWLAETCFRNHRPADDPLPSRLSAAGIQSALVTDEQLVHAHPLSVPFHVRHLVEHPAPASRADVSDTELARVFGAAVESYAGLKSPFCLWVHARGMGGAWDAPYEYRQQFADEDDPLPPDILVPPAVKLNENYDPDDLWGYARAYGGQVLVLDACLGALLDAIENSPHSDSTLLIITSPRGFPMGEHLRVGDVEVALYSELLHVPLLIRHPNRAGATLRRPFLAQPFDLFATLMSWFGQTHEVPAEQSCDLLSGADDPTELPRAYSAARFAQELAIRSAHWFYRRAALGSELYVKPDDRFEANEVLARCSDVAADFEDLALTHFTEIS